MFRSLINFFRYRKFVEKNKDELLKDFNLKIDRIYRLGTIVSIPKERISVLRGYKNPELDVHKSLEEEVKRYIKKFDIYLMQNNLTEFIGLYDADRIGDNDVLVLMSYKKFNTVKVANASRLISVISLLTLFVGFFSLWFMIPGAVVFILTLILNISLFKKLFI